MYVDVMKTEEFDAVYRILEESFPPDEFRPYDEQKALLLDARYRIYVLRDDTDTVCGMLALWTFDSFDFIEHFAISTALRNGGHGSFMLSTIVQARTNPICLEVEPPACAMARRRIGFYERNGFFFNAYPYIQPAISKGRNPIPLYVMTTRGAVDKPTFDAMRATLYSEVYRCD